MNRWIMYDNIKPQMKIVVDRGLVSRAFDGISRVWK